MVFKEMYNAAKKAVSDRVIKNPERLRDLVIEQMEDSDGVSEYGKSLAQQIPVMYEMYGRGHSMENQLKFILKEVEDDKLKSDLETLFNRFNRVDKINEVLGK